MEAGICERSFCPQSSKASLSTVAFPLLTSLQVLDAAAWLTSCLRMEAATLGAANVAHFYVEVHWLHHNHMQRELGVLLDHLQVRISRYTVRPVPPLIFFLSLKALISWAWLGTPVFAPQDTWG